jgi:hypothetical protein
LFQKPYFELLFGALKEGGVITTQGCTFSFISVNLVALLMSFLIYNFSLFSLFIILEVVCYACCARSAFCLCTFHPVYLDFPFRPPILQRPR